MFHTTIIVFLALTLFVAATPSVRDPERTTDGIRIPLSKRSSLTNADGTLNHDKTAHELAKLKSKYKSFVKPGKSGPSPDEAAVKSRATISETLERRGSVNLIDQMRSTLWSGELKIGSPAQTFVVDFDTGSSDLWLLSANCTDCSYAQKHTYDATNSSQSKPGTFSITYGDNSTASGTIHTDTVTVGDVTVTGQFLASASNVSGNFLIEPIDGILGLGLPAISNLGHDPFIFTALNQGVIKNGIFAFKLAHYGSELFVGGTNTERYTGAIEYHDVLGSNSGSTQINSGFGFWLIGNGSVSVGGKNVLNSTFNSIIDSGTSFILAPPESAKAFWQNVSEDAFMSDDLGQYVVPCNVASVAFSWGGQSWSISADNLFIAYYNSTFCVGSIVPAEVSVGGEDVWVLGDSFMKNVYSVFSVDKDNVNHKVGFAELT